MKSKRYISKILISFTIIFGIHLIGLFSGIFHLPFQSIFAVDGFLALLFSLGTLIIAPGLDKAPDNFVNRFLILTTLQLMMAMFAILIIAVVKIDHVKMVGYHLLGVFLVLMTMQSIHLVKTINLNISEK